MKPGVFGKVIYNMENPFVRNWVTSTREVSKLSQLNPFAHDLQIQLLLSA